MFLAWEIPLTEEPGELRFMGLWKSRTLLSSNKVNIMVANLAFSEWCSFVYPRSSSAVSVLISWSSQQYISWNDRIWQCAFFNASVSRHSGFLLFNSSCCKRSPEHTSPSPAAHMGLFSRVCLGVGHGIMCMSDFKDTAVCLPAPQWLCWFVLSCKTPPCFTFSPTLTTLRLLYFGQSSKWTSLVTQLEKNPPAMQETWVQSLDLEEPLEKGMATHSSVLAWEVLWTEEPDGLQSTSWTRLSDQTSTITNRWTEVHYSHC